MHEKNCSTCQIPKDSAQVNSTVHPSIYACKNAWINEDGEPLLSKDDLDRIATVLDLVANIPRPIHSDFLVVAVVEYVDRNGEIRYITGANSETCILTSCICAERTAMVQLRLQPHGYQYITAVYITTTAKDALITPGLLCREYMQEYRGFLDVPISGKSESLLLAQRPSRDVKLVLLTQDLIVKLGDSVASVPGMHETIVEKGSLVVYSLADMYPAPPLYHRVERSNLVDTAKEFTSVMEHFDADSPTSSAFRRLAESLEKRLLAMQDADASFSLDGWIQCAKDEKDTRSLLDHVEDKLRDLYSQVKKTACDTVSADHLYPIHLAGGLLFSDGSIHLARQDKCLEYGCSIDAASKLSYLLKDQLRSSDGPTPSPSQRVPLVLLHADQFGILQAPPAPSRSWWQEYGFGEVAVPVHDRDTGDIVLHDFNSLAPAAPAIVL